MLEGRVKSLWCWTHMLSLYVESQFWVPILSPHVPILDSLHLNFRTLKNLNLKCKVWNSKDTAFERYGWHMIGDSLPMSHGELAQVVFLCLVQITIFETQSAFKQLKTFKLKGSVLFQIKMFFCWTISLIIRNHRPASFDHDVGTHYRWFEIFDSNDSSFEPFSNSESEYIRSEQYEFRMFVGFE